MSDKTVFEHGDRDDDLEKDEIKASLDFALNHLELVNEWLSCLKS